MDDLITRLRSAIDEAERLARAATAGPWRVDSETYAEIIYGADDTPVVAGGRWGGEASVFESTADALHIAAQNPDATLRMVAAHRKILGLHAGQHNCTAWDAEHEDGVERYADIGGWEACATVLAVAEGYGIVAP